MKVLVYPRLPSAGGRFANPYISDFVSALQAEGVEVVNPPHKNPLFSLLPYLFRADVYIFHWLENVPDYKHGRLQSLTARLILLIGKLTGKKIVWFLHNRRPHATTRMRAKGRLIKLLMRRARLIVTHAGQGVELMRGQGGRAVERTVFLHHPTKNRLPDEAQPLSVTTDLLIWGTISPYKGVAEFLRHVHSHRWPYRVKVIGRCASAELWAELQSYASPHVTLENRSLTFEELRQEIVAARFVLVPYVADSVLSSAVLMDSLSMGARVIGPEAGSFIDYAAEPLLQVFTFRTFDDLLPLLCQSQPPVDHARYRRFLEAHSSRHFARKLIKLLQA